MVLMNNQAACMQKSVFNALLKDLKARRILAWAQFQSDEWLYMVSIMPQLEAEIIQSVACLPYSTHYRIEKTYSTSKRRD